MKKLIKADLSAILRLAGESRFLAADSLDLCIAKLCRQEYTDFLFLARTPWCCLFGFPAVYVCGSYANLCTLACCNAPGGAVTALFLHIDKTVRGQPWGSVTLLEYPIVAQDVGGCPSCLPPCGSGTFGRWSSGTPGTSDIAVFRMFLRI